MFLQDFLISDDLCFLFWSCNWKPHSWERGWSLNRLNGYAVLMIHWLCWSTRNVHVCCVNVTGIRPWHRKRWAKNLWDLDATPFLHSAGYCRQLIKSEFHVFHYCFKCVVCWSKGLFPPMNTPSPKWIAKEMTCINRHCDFSHCSSKSLDSRRLTVPLSRNRGSALAAQPKGSLVPLRWPRKPSTPKGYPPNDRPQALDGVIPAALCAD